MTTDREPLRLSSDAADPELAELLGRAKDDVLEPERVERLARAFAGPTSIPPGGGGGGAGASGRTLKLVGGTLGGLGVILAGALALSPRSSAKLEHGPNALPIPVIAASQQEKWLPPPLQLAEKPEPVASAPKPAASAPRSGVEEYQLIRAARAALPNDPTRALALAREHAKKFPHGMLVQERQVIEISALRKLGRAGEAQSETKAFEKAYPNSPHNSKFDQEKAP
jgi:hypothetical protein